MKKAIELVTNKTVFKVGYIAFLAINMIPIFNVLSFTRYILAIFIAWGAAMIVADVVKYKLDYFKKDYIFLGIAFVCSCGVSCLLNWGNTGLRYTAMLALSMFCFCILAKNDWQDKEKVKAEIRYIGDVFSVISILAVLASIVMFVIQFSFELEGRAGQTIILGFFENRLFGVFSSPNVGASFSFIAIAFSIMGIILLKNKLSVGRKVFYSFVIILNYIYIALSLSRGGMLSLFAATIVFFLFVCVKQKNFVKWNIVVQYLVRIVAGVLAVLVLYGAISVTRTVMSYAPILVDKVSGETIGSSELVSFERIETGRSDIDISNKRFSIWKASIKLMNGKYIMGIGNTKLKKTEQEYIDEGILNHSDFVYLESAQGNTHNGYIKVFTNGGVIASLLLAAFLLITALRGLLKYKYNGEKSLFAGITAVIAYFLLNNMIETNFVLMGANIFQAIFWLFIGYYLYFCCNVKKQEETGEAAAKQDE